MTHRYAGRYGPLAPSDNEGNVDPAALVDVFLPGTTTRPPLYTTKNRSSALANPLPESVAVGQPGLDVAGNIMFFADPGDYDIRVTFETVLPGTVRTLKVTIAPDAQETEDERDERLAAAQLASEGVDEALAVTVANIQQYVEDALAGVGGGGGGGSSFTLRGAWSPSTAYVKDDIVLYDGSSYVATQAVGPQSTFPSMQPIWQLLAVGVSAALSNTINNHEFRIDALEQAGPGDPGSGGGSGVTIDNIAANSLIAFRCGWALGPEHTLEAARLSTAVGARGVHANVRRLADGALVAFTDASVDRTTTSTGDLINLTAPGYQQLNLDAESWFAPPWTGLKPIAVQRLFEEFAGHAVLVLEPMAAATRSLLCAEIVARGAQNHALVVVSDVEGVAAVKAAGCRSLLRVDFEELTADALTEGVSVIAASANTSNADLDLIKSQMLAYPGVQLWGWEIDHRAERDRLRLHGATVLVTSEPGYVKSDRVISPSATWATNTYPHGLIAADQDVRPGIITGGILTFAASGQQWALSGEMAPIPDEYRLDVEFRWPSLPAEAAPLERVGLAFGMNDDNSFSWSGTVVVPDPEDPELVDLNQLRDGYIAELLKNGSIRLVKVNRTANTVTELGVTTSTALVANTWYGLRVQVSDTGIVVTRVDTAVTVSSSDTSHRGGYVHLGKYGSVATAQARNLARSAVGVVIDPPAVPASTMFGAFAGTNDPNTAADTTTELKAWRNFNAAPPVGVGPHDARRSNDMLQSGPPVSWAVSSGSFDEAEGAPISYYQFRTPWQDTLDGDFDAQITAFINSIPNDHDVWVAWGPNAPNTASTETQGLTAAGFVAAYQRVAGLIRATGKTNVKTAWVADVKALIDAGTVESWYPGKTAVNVVAFRTFNQFDPTVSSTVWSSAVSLLTEPVAWAVAKGKQWGIWDLGSREDPNAPNRKAGWIDSIIAFSENNPRAKFINYFNSGMYRLRTSTAAEQAWSQAVNPGTLPEEAVPAEYESNTVVERSNVTSILFDVPSDVSNGSTLLLCVACGLGAPDLGLPTDPTWAAVGPQVNDVGASQLSTRMYWKRWNTGDDMTGSIPASVSTRASVACVRYSGAKADLIDAYATEVDADSDAVVPSPGLVTSVQGVRLVRFFAHRGLGTSWTPPAGTSLRAQRHPSNTAGAQILVVDEVVQDSGVVPGRSATSDLASNYGVGWTVAMKPGVGGTGGGDPEPGDFTFAGDPGPGKTYIGWYVENGNYDKHKDEQVRIQETVPPGGAARASRKPSINRDFIENALATETFSGGVGGNGGTGIYGTHHSSKTDDTSARESIRDGQVHMPSYSCAPTGTRSAQAFVNGDYDTWIEKLAEELNDIRDRYNGVVWGNMANEPDQPDKTFFNHSNRMAALRNAARKLHFDLKSMGVTNFEMTTPTYVQQTLYSSNVWGKRPRIERTNDADPVPSEQRWSAWWEWHPDWKGPRAGTPNGEGRNASWDRAACVIDGNKAFDPNPLDFYQGDERVCKIVAVNAYCWHAMSGYGNYNPVSGIWTWDSNPASPSNNNIYENHAFLSGDDEHAQRMHQIWQNLYPDGDYRVIIGEHGWPIYEQSGLGNTFPGITVDFLAGSHFDELMEAQVVGFVWWKAVPDNTVAQQESGGNSFGGRLTSVSGKEGATDDPRHIGANGKDCRRKAVAAGMDRTEHIGHRTVGPPP